MDVKEIITMACENLQKNDILDMEKLGGDETSPSSLTLSEYNLMLVALNLIYSEIATDYIPLIKKESLTVSDNLITLDDLEERLINVVKITDLNGCNLKYTLYPSSLEVDSTSCELYYSYLPDKLTEATDEVETFGGKITPRIMALGVTAEFCFINSNFEDAAIWDQRYKDSLLISARKKSEIVMKPRRWF